MAWFIAYSQSRLYKEEQLTYVLSISTSRNNGIDLITGFTNAGLVFHDVIFHG